eukprot:1144128-Pelagomonas_calceolata.AAC.8
MGGQPSLKRCTDARLGLNITYNTLLPLEVRPGPESTQGPSESELGRPYIPPSDTAEGACVCMCDLGSKRCPQPLGEKLTNYAFPPGVVA